MYVCIYICSSIDPCPFGLVELVLCSVSGIPCAWSPSLRSWSWSCNWFALWIPRIILGKVCTYGPCNVNVSHSHIYYICLIQLLIVCRTYVRTYMQHWQSQRINYLLIQKAYQWFCCQPWRGRGSWNRKYDRSNVLKVFSTLKSLNIHSYVRINPSSCQCRASKSCVNFLKQRKKIAHNPLMEFYASGEERSDPPQFLMEQGQIWWRYNHSQSWHR